MTLTIAVAGLDAISMGLSVMTAIMGMMAIGALNEGVGYLRNPYLRRRRSKIILNKMNYAFA